MIIRHEYRLKLDQYRELPPKRSSRHLGGRVRGVRRMERGQRRDKNEQRVGVYVSALVCLYVCV